MRRRGSCVAGAPPSLDDGDACTLDLCDPALGAVHPPAPAGTPCLDANPCNGDEICDGAGACAQIIPPVIDDGDACTLDACEPASGITHVACSPPDPTIATTMLDSLAFLYSGAAPVQIGVAPGIFDIRRAAAVRGVVRTADGSAHAGVSVEILDHPEYGSTQTLADGTFTLAVNGGGPLVVSYEADGYLPVARHVDVPWQTFAQAPEIVLTQYDVQVTAIDLASPAGATAARGSQVSDTEGARQATVLFPSGTTAEMVLPGGGTVPLSTLSVRATEYTIGDAGPEAMPATLPPTSGYTYAVELSVDEAVAAGGRVRRVQRTAAVLRGELPRLPGRDDRSGGLLRPRARGVGAVRQRPRDRDPGRRRRRRRRGHQRRWSRR
jgi:hypothetical protein